MHDKDTNRKNWSDLVIGRPFKERSFQFLMFSSLYEIKCLSNERSVMPCKLHLSVEREAW